MDPLRPAAPSHLVPGSRRSGTQCTGARLRDPDAADVRAQYTPAEDGGIVDTTIVSQQADGKTERAHGSGSLAGVVRIFDDAWVLTWPGRIPGKSGVIVSIQRGGTTATLDDVERCPAHLAEEIEPRIE